jgi:hypothetical protein
VNQALNAIDEPAAHAPNYAVALRTAVFSSQLSKLKTVDDPLVISIIHFYSDLGTLEQVIDGANRLSVEYNSLNPYHAQRAVLQPRVKSILRVMSEKMSDTATQLRKLRNRLPFAQADSIQNAQ